MREDLVGGPCARVRGRLQQMIVQALAERFEAPGRVRQETHELASVERTRDGGMLVCDRLPLVRSWDSDRRGYGTRWPRRARVTRASAQCMNPWLVTGKVSRKAPDLPL
jgi:hypothetical protein